MSNEINALSIIDTVEIDNIANTMAKIQQMQNVVQKTLKKGHDFGEVPGTSKPTLLKPGGEKICMLFRSIPFRNKLDIKIRIFFKKGIFKLLMYFRDT